MRAKVLSLQNAGPPAGSNAAHPPRRAALCQRNGCRAIKNHSKARRSTEAHQAEVGCRAVGADPDAYALSYDSDDESDDLDPEYEELLATAAATNTPVLEQASSLPERVEMGTGVVLKTLANAPLEIWNAVKITAGAAGVLLTRRAEKRLQEAANEVHNPQGSPHSPLRESGGDSQSSQPHTPVDRAREKWREARNEMPEGTWGKIQWLWDQPPVKKLRITISMAQWSVRLPAIMALLATQMGLIASQVSLPMLAPLLLGTGMMLRSIRSNASIIFPRICVLVVLLYVLWFANSLVQSTVVYLRRQGALDPRLSGAIITASECCALLAALVIVLSMIGVNVSGLLLPAGIALAYAAKDLSHNFLAGFFLFVVQPFRLGDRISVSYSTPAAANSANRSAWFEGTCEKVDLRYTIVKNGSRRLFVPNSAFLTREFMVVDDSAGPQSPEKRDLFPAEHYGQRPVWAQAPLQTPQPGWMRQPGDLSMGEVGPSGSVGPEEGWPAMEPQPASQQPYPQVPQPPPDAGSLSQAPEGSVQENSNVLEWQRRQSGGHREQLAPDKDLQWPRNRNRNG